MAYLVRLIAALLTAALLTGGAGFGVSSAEAGWLAKRVEQANRQMARTEGTGLRDLESYPERTDTGDVRYAVTIRPADIRITPTRERQTSDDPHKDLLQESGAAPGVPFAVLQTSDDGAWHYAVTDYTEGWVSAADLAFTDRETFRQLWERQRTAKDSLVLASWAEVNGQLWPAGTILPLAKDQSKGLTVLLPEADAAGNLSWKEDVWASDTPHPAPFTLFTAGGRPVSLGFVTPTAENLQALAALTEGLGYGWGDEGGVPDCSSYIRGLFRVMGYRLPRNTGEQAAIPIGRLTIPDGDDARAAFFAGLPVGTLLVSPGHAMLSWGTDASGTARILHDINRYFTPAGEEVRCFGRVLTSVLVQNPPGVCYRDSIHTAIRLMPAPHIDRKPLISYNKTD